MCGTLVYYLRTYIYVMLRRVEEHRNHDPCVVGARPLRGLARLQAVRDALLAGVGGGDGDDGRRVPSSSLSLAFLPVRQPAHRPCAPRAAEPARPERAVVLLPARLATPLPHQRRRAGAR